MMIPSVDLFRDYLKVEGNDLVFPCYVSEGMFNTVAIVRDWDSKWKVGVVVVLWDQRRWRVDVIRPHSFYVGQVELGLRFLGVMA